MILEGLVTTTNPQGEMHFAPMGPRVDSQSVTPGRLLLKPFKTSRTYQNLMERPEGVFHIVDDVLLLAKAAIGRIHPAPPCHPAFLVKGWILENSCRFHEFRIDRVDTTGDRAELEAKIVYTGHQKEFFGLNRAKHAVVEAAILVTRIHLIPPAEIEEELKRLEPLILKTGGDQEKEAFELIRQTVKEACGVNKC